MSFIINYSQSAFLTVTLLKSFSNIIDISSLLHVVQLKSEFLKLFVSELPEGGAAGQSTPTVYGYTDLGDAYIGLESFFLEFNGWSFIILTATSMSLLAFWAINPHPSFFFSLLIFEIIFICIALETIGISKALGITGGFVFALFLLTFAALESAIGLAYLVFFSKQLRGVRSYL